MNDHAWLLTSSIEVILDNQSPSGSYIACPQFPPYRYSWFRDGAFIAEAMSRVGQTGSADRFHRWCADILRRRSDKIDRLVARHQAGEIVAADEHLHTRYTLDGRESDEPWWTFQLDGYGTWLWALDRHLRRHNGDTSEYLDAVAAAVRYTAAFWDQPCYDWWEEHVDRIHTSTLAALAAGLGAAAGWELPSDTAELAAASSEAIVERITTEAVHDGHLAKWVGNTAVDASLIAAFVPFEIFPADAPLATATIARIENDLAPAGVHRYLEDVYYGGGEWILLAGFLGCYHATAGNRDRAGELLDWMAAQADRDGKLPEQVNTHLLHPEQEQRWIERWGPSATPLLWSHAMLLTLADDLGLTDDLQSAERPAVPQEMA